MQTRRMTLTPTCAPMRNGMPLVVRRISFFLALLALVAAPRWNSEAGAAPDGSPRVAATVDGRPIYANELTDREIHEARGKVFDLETTKLRKVVLKQLRETRPKEFSVPEIKIGDDEIRGLYEQANLGKRGTLEDLREQIRAYLTQQKLDDVEERYYRKAVQLGYVTSNLEQPEEFLVSLPEVTRPGSRGSRDAPVQIVEFSDFQCPFCKRALPAVTQMFEKYGDRIYFTYRHLPLVRIHPRARELAEASECAAEQGKFWQFHDAVFAADLDSAKTGEFASKAGVKDAKKYAACVEKHQYAARVDEDIKAAESLFIGGTPTFLIGERTGTGTIKGVLLEGAQPLSAFERQIEKVLAGR
jgi:protein-disulfide isomerase